jgi:hypothetical protein
MTRVLFGNSRDRGPSVVTLLQFTLVVTSDQVSATFI